MSHPSNPERFTRTSQTDHAAVRDRAHETDKGYTLIEMLVVIVVLGILGGVAWLGVSGMTTKAAGTGCLADEHHVHVAAEAFFAQTGLVTIPATGTDHDRYERTLVDRDFLRSASRYFDLDASGATTAEAPSSC